MLDALNTVKKNTFEIDAPVVFAKKVDGRSRRSTLPKKFGRFSLEVEQNIFRLMDMLCLDYNGDYWEFYHLNNGGFFMAPSTDKPYLMASPFGNFYQGTMGATAAGISATLFAYGAMAERYNEVTDIFSDQYYLLREYLFSHVECSEICQLID